jgi:DNA-directed RNA polymerase subunit N (RpoN/RPB10)
MAQPVRCDVCGKLFSSSYVGAHKRLAHRKTNLLTPSEPVAIKKIIALFKALSMERQKELLEQLRMIVLKAK